MRLSKINALKNYWKIQNFRLSIIMYVKFSNKFLKIQSKKTEIDNRHICNTNF